MTISERDRVLKDLLDAQRVLLTLTDAPVGQFIDQIFDTLDWLTKSTHGWQPISTAPRDGTKILTARCFNGWHFDVGLCENDLWIAVSSRSFIYPTHWMSLPDPPENIK